MNLNQRDRRRSGVLLHITSLPGPHGIGDFGPDAYRFVDWLASAKQTLWQWLPANADGLWYGESPGPTGVVGSHCHSVCLALASQSTKR